MTDTDSPLKEIGIIGGGLGGLVLAALLTKRSPGLRVSVFERDEGAETREQGYQIGVNPDGAKVLSELRSREILTMLKQHSYISGFVLCDANLNRLMQFRGMGGQGRGLGLVHRWKLREALAKLVEGNIYWGKRFLEYKEENDKVNLKFEDGSSAQVDFAVGCDGSRSLVRAQRCPQIQYGPLQDLYMTWGFVRDMDFPREVPHLESLMKNSLVRICGQQGQGLLLIEPQDDRFGERGVVWALSFRKTEEMKLPDGQNDQEVRQFITNTLAVGLHPEFLKLLNATKTKIPCNPMSSSTFPKDYKNIMGQARRVTLLGDSAHPMTTQAGLGANTAFMDARDLANAIGDGTGNWRKRIQKYETTMIARGVRNVATSLASTQNIHQHGKAARKRDWFCWIIGRVLLVVQAFMDAWGWLTSWFTKPKDD